MPNRLECMNVALAIAGGAVVAFFAACGWLYRVGYVAGFTAGKRAAAETFRKIIDAARARELFGDAYETLRDAFRTDDTDGTP